MCLCLWFTWCLSLIDEVFNHLSSSVVLVKASCMCVFSTVESLLILSLLCSCGAATGQRSELISSKTVIAASLIDDFANVNFLDRGKVC